MIYRYILSILLYIYSTLSYGEVYDNVYQYIHRSTYQICVEDNTDNTIGCGTAFAVSRHHLMTAHHNVAAISSPNSSPDVSLVLYQDGREISATHLYSIEEQDLALIEVDTELPAFLRLCEEDVPFGSQLYSLGYPKGRGPLPVTGFMGPQAEDEGDEYLWFTSVVGTHGHSGAPAVTDQLCVAGLLAKVMVEAWVRYAVVPYYNGTYLVHHQHLRELYEYRRTFDRESQGF